MRGITREAARLGAAVRTAGWKTAKAATHAAARAQLDALRNTTSKWNTQIVSKSTPGAAFVNILSENKRFAPDFSLTVSCVGGHPRGRGQPPQGGRGDLHALRGKCVNAHPAGMRGNALVCEESHCSAHRACGLVSAPRRTGRGVWHDA